MKDNELLAGKLAAVIVAGEHPELEDEVVDWAEVGRLLDIHFTDDERSDVMWLRKARHDASRFATMGSIEAGTEAKRASLLATADRLRSVVVDPLSRPGMAMMAHAAMLEMEVRMWRQPEDYLE